MVLPLGLWLLWAPVASQEICRSPGELPAPSLIMDRISARQNNSITLLCFIPMHILVTRVIFCKDRKEILMLPKDRNKFIFEAAQPASPESAGEYFCRYQHKDDRNQVKNSLPSAGRYLSAPDPDCCSGFPRSTVGFALVAGLALGLLGCFLMKAVLSRCRTKRDPGPDQSSPASEDQIQYAEVTRARVDMTMVDRNETVTYAAVGKGSSRAQDTRLAP